jgi:hypothetical protein
MRSAERFLVPTLLALLVAQCLLSMRVTSATFDEPSYLSAGYAALTTGVDINPAHPPLMKYFLALPLLVVGSNIDWGQDFKALARYLREHEIPQVKGLYSPRHLESYVARYYGVSLTTLTFDEVRNPQPGWYAISAHFLQRPTLTNDPVALRFDWLDRFTPVERIGYSIYLYHFD